MRGAVFQMASQKSLCHSPFSARCSVLRIFQQFQVVAFFDSSSPLWFCSLGLLRSTLGAAERSMLVLQRISSHSLSFANSAGCALSLISLVMIVVTIWSDRSRNPFHSRWCGCLFLAIVSGVFPARRDCRLAFVLLRSLLCSQGSCLHLFRAAVMRSCVLFAPLLFALFLPLLRIVFPVVRS